MKTVIFWIRRTTIALHFFCFVYKRKSSHEYLIESRIVSHLLLFKCETTLKRKKSRKLIKQNVVLIKKRLVIDFVKKSLFTHYLISDI
jgi:hypothetical protein